MTEKKGKIQKYRILAIISVTILLIITTTTYFLFSNEPERLSEDVGIKPSKAKAQQSSPILKNENITISPKTPVPDISLKAPSYKVVMSEHTFKEAERYKNDIIESKANAGKYLNSLLKGKENSEFDLLKTRSFIEMLLKTKKPTIFAESAIQGDGTDWNQKELEILGDIGVAVPVLIYDDGTHQQKSSYTIPFPGYLLYVPGALLAGKGKIADLSRVTENDRKTIAPARYESLYENRILPMLLFAEETAQKAGKMAVITIPGLGCGCFAGSYNGKLENILIKSIQNILSKHHKQLNHVKYVLLDTYKEGYKVDETFGTIKFKCIQSRGNGPAQLSSPSKLLESERCENDDILFFSVVAWDHVSLPGNDFYRRNARQTDDGVKSAATNSMESITGITGKYDPTVYKYLPPAHYRDWEEVVNKNGIQLHCDEDNLKIFEILN